MTKYPWIIIDAKFQPARMICKRCGQSMPAPVGVSVNMALVIMNQFGKEHKRCKER